MAGAKKVAGAATQGAVGAPGVIPAVPPAGADFSWAVNKIKLNRAVAYVSENQPALKGKDLEAAVRARYVEIKGLLVEDRPQPGTKKGGRVQNMADDDGSDD